MATIVADDREENGANPFFPKYVESNNKKFSKLPAAGGGGDIRWAKARVTTGDYHVLFQNQIYLTVERKTWKDLAASIKDRRVDKQHANMEELRKKHGTILLYIIEGVRKPGKDGKIGRLPAATLDTKILRIILHGTSVIHTRSPQDTASTIVSLAREIMRLEARGDKILGGSGTNGSNLIRSGINPICSIRSSQPLKAEDLRDAVSQYNCEILALNRRFTAISDQYTKLQDYMVTPKNLDPDDMSYEDYSDDFDRSISVEEPASPKKGGDLEKYADELGIEEIMNLDATNPADVPNVLTEQHIRKDEDIIEEMWCAIPNVSAKTYPVISAKYHLRDIITASPDRVKSMIRDISEMHYPSGSTRIGEKRAKAIMALAYSGTAPTKIQRVYDISVKIMSKMKGLNTDTAKIILNSCSLREICEGRISSTYLGDITRPNGRRIGKVAEGIVDILGIE